MTPLTAETARLSKKMRIVITKCLVIWLVVAVLSSTMALGYGALKVLAGYLNFASLQTPASLLVFAGATALTGMICFSPVLIASRTNPTNVPLVAYIGTAAFAVAWHLVGLAYAFVGV